jgi:hypothetical protein
LCISTRETLQPAMIRRFFCYSWQVRRREISNHMFSQANKNRQITSLFIRAITSRSQCGKSVHCATLRCSSLRFDPLCSGSNWPLSVSIIACLMSVLILTSSHNSSSRRARQKNCFRSAVSRTLSFLSDWKNSSDLDVYF